MKFLLDTQTLVWMIESPNRLTKEVSEIIETSNAIYVSVESLREIVIKKKLGSIKLKTDFQLFCSELQKQYGVKIVNTELNHIITLHELTIPIRHNDPFDHLIISTAIAGKFTLISADSKFPFYTAQGLKLIVN